MRDRVGPGRRLLAAGAAIVLGSGVLLGTAGPAAAVPPPCSAARLAGALGASSGAAGTIYNIFVLTNVSGSPCRMSGYPTLRRYGPTGRPQATTLSTDIAPGPATVTLAPGAKASFVWAYSNVPSGSNTTCGRTRVLAVAPPGSSGSLYLAVDVPRCSGSLRVSAVAAGVLQP